MNDRSKSIQPKTVITIRKGDEYRSRVACIYQQNAFFYQSYLQAGQCVAEILDAAGRYYSVQTSKLKDPCDGMEAIPLSEFAQIASYPNNIIAFCGERGGGKTSAMVSFAKGLELFHLKMQKNDKQATAFWKKSGLDPHKLSQYRFIALDSIDPTSMEQMDSILRIVLSRLFDKFRHSQPESHTEDPCSYVTVSQEALRKQIRIDFQKCFQALDTLKEKRNEDFCYDDLDYLVELNDSSTLKQKMMRLVKDLCCLLSDNPKECFLVIQIDDTDLNAQHAFEIMEDIRKYLVLPGVIIILSTDLHQLEMLIEQHYVDEFRALIDCSMSLDIKATLPDRLGCHNSAERYINKLLPSIHQIHLPKLEYTLRYSATDLCLSYLSNGEEQFKGNNRLQNALLHLLYKKTRIILLTPLREKHSFLPSTIRMLTHFLTFFCRLPDLPRNISFDALYLISLDEPVSSQITEARNLCIQNLEEVEQYFRQIWCHFHLTAPELIEMEKLFSASFPKMNQQTTLLIKNLFENQKYTSNPINTTQILSYAEIFSKLRKMKDSDDCEQRDITFAIEFCYTLSMHRWLITYNILKETEDSLSPQINELLKFMDYTGVDAPIFFSSTPV